MVDWEQVEKLRSKGWDWSRIADDPKVGFQADSAVGDSGRALRALYYQRRSRQSRKRGTEAEEGGRTRAEREEAETRRWSLLRLGYLLVPLGGLWFLLAYVYPSPVGVFVTAIPWVALVLVVGAVLLGVGLLRSTPRWSTVSRNTVVLGAILGLVVAGGIGLVAIATGCPTLSASTTGEPQNWVKASNPAWTSGGAPVFLFYGSVACPFCSSTSWAVLVAMTAFGTVNTAALVFDVSSSPGDPDTPEVYVNSIQITSPYVSLDSHEDTTNGAIHQPSVGCVEGAYVSAYNPGGSIPFIVVNGQYYHTGTMVDPNAIHGLSPQTVYNEVTSQSGTAWTAVSHGAYTLIAFLLKANNGQPASILSDPKWSSVVPIYQGIS